MTPRILAAFRGGDNHLLTGIGRIIEMYGFRIVGINDVAPDLLMPAGIPTRTEPDGWLQPTLRRGLGCCVR